MNMLLGQSSVNTFTTKVSADRVLKDGSDPGVCG